MLEMGVVGALVHSEFDLKHEKYFVSVVVVNLRNEDMATFMIVRGWETFIPKVKDRSWPLKARFV